MKILVIGPSWIGDMMLSQSLYRTLLHEYPYAKIDVIAPAWSFPLLMSMPEVNKAILMPMSHGDLFVRKRWHIGSSLRTKQYDRAYVLPNSFKSALVPFFADVPQRTGWRGEMRYGLLNDMRMLNKAAFPLMIQRYVVLAYDKRVVQCANDLPHPLLLPKLHIQEEEITKITTMFNLSGARPIIGFCPGAEFGLIKCWPHYHYAKLAQRLIERGYKIALFGSENDYIISEKICTSLQIDAVDHCMNFSGKTKLNQVISLISSCEAIVSNDSGLMHIAAALNKPVVALYGPSSPDFTPPLSNKAKVIRVISGDCKVPKGMGNQVYHKSLIDIPPKQVLEALTALLHAREACLCKF